MIFVSVGSMFPFDRLVRAADEWAADNGRPDMLIQIGNGEYQPQAARWVRSLPPHEFRTVLGKCSLFVAHLGMGSLMSGAQTGIPTLLMPRLQSLGEHNTDHQRDAVRWIRGRPGVWIADDEVGLKGLLSELHASRDNARPAGIPAYASDSLIQAVKLFIQKP